jgi:hypothetical protein
VELRKRLLNMLYIWIALHHCSNDFTFVDFLNLFSSCPIRVASPYAFNELNYNYLSKYIYTHTHTHISKIKMLDQIYLTDIGISTGSFFSIYWFIFNNSYFTIYVFVLETERVHCFSKLQVHSLCKRILQTGPNKGSWKSYFKLLSTPKKIRNW